MNQPSKPCSPPRIEQRNELGLVLRRYPPFRPEKHQRYEEKDPDQTAQQPMGILVGEDPLESRQVHALIYLLVFRVLLVLFESFLPLLFIEGRNRAHDRLPFHDGQAGTRQAGHPAQHDHAENDGGTDKQPGGHLTVVTLLQGIDHGRDYRGDQKTRAIVLDLDPPGQFDRPFAAAVVVAGKTHLKKCGNLQKFTYSGRRAVNKWICPPHHSAGSRNRRFQGILRMTIQQEPLCP